VILHLIELTYVGPLRETVRVGPFAPGLNILAAPNESGKSTVLRAAARALFDKHTTRSEEIKSLQPAGADLAPRVAVEFETGAGRYRIEKTFLQSPRSLLKQWSGDAWQPVAEADAADQRVQELLHSSLPGRGATRPEHWGFLGFLWARQGEPADWPSLDDEAVGQRIRASLARVEIDPVIDTLRARLAVTADAVLTTTGQPKTGGALRQADDDLAAIETEMAALRQTRAELDATHQRWQQADAAAAILEKEHAAKEESTKALGELALSAERLRGEFETRQAELTTARGKLTAITADAGTLTRRQSEAASARDALAAAERAAHDAGEQLAALRARIDREQSTRPDHESRLNTLRAGHQRLQALLRLRQSSAEAAALGKQAGKTTEAAARIAGLESKLAGIPALKPAGLRKLEELADTVRTQQAQIQALGLAVDLTPDAGAPVVIHEGATTRRETLPAGKPSRLHSPQSLDLELTGWGRILIRSGAMEAQHLADELAKSEARLRDALQDAEVTSIEAAREAVANRRELDVQLKAAASVLAGELGDHESLEALRAAATSAARRVEALSTTLDPTAAEAALGATQIESEEARLAESIPAAEAALKDLDTSLAQLRTDERAAAEALQKAARLAGEQRARLHALDAQIADAAARHPAGIDATKSQAQMEFVQAEARAAAARAGLPPDFEKLPERNRRAAIALQQVVNELRARRAERDSASGSLEALGGQGLYSRETELEERKAEATLRRDAARLRGWSARIAHDLIDHRKQAATRSALAPLEHRLTAAFAELTGDSQRKIFLDDELQIAGIGPTREQAHPFDLLSQGAKEQLVLCLRVAVAQELSAGEPQVLILDDVLVNTDPVRQERILDVLGALASQLQIIILTCHADRYRGAGQPITIARAG